MADGGNREHSYAVAVEWAGNRGTGTSDYRAYGREQMITATHKPAIPGSSDPAFRGDAARWNPEDLVVASLAACHQLWYLHLCAVNGICVLAYRDEASRHDGGWRGHRRAFYARHIAASCNTAAGRRHGSCRAPARRGPFAMLCRQLGKLPGRARADDRACGCGRVGNRDTVTAVPRRRERYEGKGTAMKVQGMRDLAAEMRAVARGEIAAPPDAAAPSVESAEALRGETRRIISLRKANQKEQRRWQP